MKRKLLKTFLLAAGLLVGMSAWAQTYTYEVLYGNETKEGDVTTGVTAQTEFTENNQSDNQNDQNNNASLNIVGSSLYAKGTGFTKNFAEPVTTGKVYFSGIFRPSANNAQTLQIVTNSGYVVYGSTTANSNRNQNNDIASICGTNITVYTRNGNRANHYFNICIDLDTKKLTYTFTIGTSDGGTTTTGPTIVDLSEDVTDIKGLKFNSNSWGAYLDNVMLYSEISNETKYTYTINYKEGEDIIQTESANVIAGTVITAKTKLNKDDVKYLIVADGDAPTLEVTAGGSNILNVPFRKAYKATVNVTTTIGGAAEEPVSTTFVESDDKICSWNYSYPLYVKKDDVYYKADETATFGESGVFTDGQVINKSVSYTTADPTVVFFVEAEGLGGYVHHTNSFDNTKSGCLTAAVNAENKRNRGWSVGTLETGNYTFITYLAGHNRRAIGLRNNTSESDAAEYIVSATSTSSASSETLYEINFTLDASTSLCINGANSGSDKTNESESFDYILIKKLPATVSAPITSATGYATFSSTYALDFSEVTGLTAYKATACDGNNVTLVPVTGTVAANTGLVIKGTTTNIPVVATGDEATGNLLFALDGSYSPLKAATDGGTNYVLSVQDDEAVFAPIGATPAPVTAGHAALHYNASSARTLNIVFADEATGISAVQNSKEQSDEVYNLAGQRVAQPAKGLYIVNGKKVIMK